MYDILIRGEVPGTVSSSYHWMVSHLEMTLRQQPRTDCGLLAGGHQQRAPAQPQPAASGHSPHACAVHTFTRCRARAPWLWWTEPPWAGPCPLPQSTNICMPIACLCISMNPNFSGTSCRQPLCHSRLDQDNKYPTPTPNILISYSRTVTQDISWQIISKILM